MASPDKTPRNGKGGKGEIERDAGACVVSYLVPLRHGCAGDRLPREAYRADDCTLSICRKALPSIYKDSFPSASEILLSFSPEPFLSFSPPFLKPFTPYSHYGISHPLRLDRIHPPESILNDDFEPASPHLKTYSCTLFFPPPYRRSFVSRQKRWSEHEPWWTPRCSACSI